MGAILEAAIERRPKILPPAPKDTVIPKEGNGSLGDVLTAAIQKRNAAVR